MNSPASQASYIQDGYQTFPGILSQPWLALATSTCNSVITRHRHAEPPVIKNSVNIGEITLSRPQRNPGIEASALHNEPFIIGNLLSLDDRFKSLLAEQVLWSIAAKLLKAELNQIVFHYANLTRKPAGTGPAIAWHRDNENTYFCPEDDRFLRLLIPLQGMSKINGGTGIVASSHVNVCHITATDENQVIYPTVSAGSMLAIHPSLLHGGQPNRSHLERDVIIMQFGVQGSSLRHQDTLELGALQTWQDFSKL